MNKWYKVTLVVVLAVIVGVLAFVYNDGQNTGEEVVARSPQVKSVDIDCKTKCTNINKPEILALENRELLWIPQEPIMEQRENTPEENHDNNGQVYFTRTPTGQEHKEQVYTEPCYNTGALFTESDVVMIAKTLGVECPDVSSKTEQACVVWCILNRVDAGLTASTIYGVITYPNQFAYYSGTPVRQDLYNLALDVLTRWEREKNGETNVGRVLPSDYMWYTGDCIAHNYFRNQYRGGGIWDYSLPSPYDT